MVNNLPPLAGPVDASGEPVDLTNHHNAARCPYCNPLLDSQHMEISRLKSDVAFWKGEFDKLRAAAVPSSPAQEDVHPSQLLMDVLKQASVFDEVLGRVQMYGAADRVRDAWRLLKDAILTVHRAAIPPSSPVADSPTKKEKQ